MHAFHALAIDDGSGGAGFAFALLSTPHVQRVMNAIERAIVAPHIEVVEQRAARRQVFRHRPAGSRPTPESPFALTATTVGRYSLQLRTNN
jgi:hypothetical protein